MAINIKFDLIGNPEPPTIILANRNGNKLGQLYVEPKSINLIDKLNEASEIAFTVYKYVDGEITNLWDKVVNFKLIYCKEWDCWFEITVELDEETETVKTVLGTQLGQAELSQIMLYDIHVNEEGDPNWDSNNESYKSTILYDPEDSSASLLHRLLEKAPHYSIAHVDKTIKNIQRTFSFDGTSIYDAFQEIAEEIECLFVFHSGSGDFNGSIINEESLALYENLINEQDKIEDWGLSEFGSAFKISRTNFEQHKFGNVDMDKRVVITWSDSLKSAYSNALASWDYDPEVGSIDTVFGGSSRFGEDVLETGVEVAYTPIVIVDYENGEAIFVDADTVYSYIEELVAESTLNGVFDKYEILALDKEGRNVNGVFVQNIIAATDLSLNYDDNGNWAETVGRLMHFSGRYGAVSLAQNDIIEYAESVGISFEEFIYAHQNGKSKAIRRAISVYDLQKSCNECGYRGELVKVCPKCESINVKHYHQQYCDNCGYQGGFLEICPDCNSTDTEMGYGQDTTIFVTTDELASGGIQLTTDTGSVKNCFKLEAGDDLMTATIRNRNPNGTDYIWYFSDTMKEDMPDEMVSKIEEYDELYEYYYNDHISELDESLVNKYNTLVDKYLVYKEDLKKISSTIEGFAALMQAYYNTIDLGWYLKSGLMPDVTMGETDAEEQGLLLEISLPSLIAVSDLKIVSETTTDNYVEQMARAIVNSSYKVKINSSQLSGTSWSGDFIITNYSDEEDTYTTSTISRTLTDWDETYIKQKIDKLLSKENTDNLSITGLFAKDIIASKNENDEYEFSGEFWEELHKYALAPLESFQDACQACIDLLIEQGVGSSTSWGTTESGDEGNLYEKLYIPYYKKLKAIEVEISLREEELNIILGIYDEETGKLKTEGMQTNIESLKVAIQNELNFQDYFGEDLWKQFCAYRREDKYSNSNYTSDGLNNTELFARALEFYEVAENEIFKSSELQHSISATLNNLLAIPKFKPLVKSFKVGNWIRVLIDGSLYKLRLVEYEINYDDFDNVSVKFSDVTKEKNGFTDLESVLSDASSMASSYDSIKRQANLGNEAQNMIRKWLDDGLEASLTQIQNNTNEEIVINRNGLIGRSKNDINDNYSPEQIRLTHNIMAYTDNDWESVKMAIGKHKYNYYDEGKNEFVDAEGYGVSADFVTAGIVSGSQIIGGNIYSDNYSITAEVCRSCGYVGEFETVTREKTDEDGNIVYDENESIVYETVTVCPECNEENTRNIGTGSYINLRDGTFSFGGGALQFNNGKLIISSNTADTNITELNDKWLKTTTVYAKNLSVNAANVSGKLTAAEIDAGQITSGKITATYIDATDLEVDAANVKGELTAATISADNIQGGTIDADLINAGDLDMTGVISWSDLDADAQNKASYYEWPSYCDLSGIDFTEIGGNYIRSPNIAGGTISGAEIYGGAYNDLNRMGRLELNFRDTWPAMIFSAINDDGESYDDVFTVHSLGSDVCTSRLGCTVAYKRATMGFGGSWTWTLEGYDEPYGASYGEVQAIVSFTGKHIFSNRSSAVFEGYVDFTDAIDVKGIYAKFK